MVLVYFMFSLILLFAGDFSSTCGLLSLTFLRFPVSSLTFMHLSDASVYCLSRIVPKLLESIGKVHGSQR